MSVSAVVVAAGRGKRFGSSVQRPKQFRILQGRPLLYWPLKTFEDIPSLHHTVLVVSRGYLGWAERFVRRCRFHKVFAVVAGGRERAGSVRNGVRALPSDTDVVLIHDAARALVSRDIVERVIAAVRRTGVALAAWPVPDTLKSSRASSGKTLAVGTIPRKGLWLAQTPQGFRREIADKVFHRRGRSPFTDDVQLAERAGYPVEVVPGSPINFKMTVPEDFEICQALVKSRGSGKSA